MKKEENTKTGDCWELEGSQVIVLMRRGNSCKEGTQLRMTGYSSCLNNHISLYLIMLQPLLTVYI